MQVNNRNYFFGDWVDFYGEAIVLPTGDASLSVKFNGEVATLEDDPGYLVMDTDYDTYSIVYSCNDLFFGYFSLDYLWILYREPVMPAESLNARLETIKEKLPHYSLYTDAVIGVQGPDVCPYEEIIWDSDRMQM